MPKPLLITVITFLLLAASCQRNDSVIRKRPVNVMSKSQMIDFLVDMHLAEASLRTSAVQAQRGDSSLQKPYITVFKKHGVTQEQFNLSLDYYIRQVDKLDEIYNEVINRLISLEAERQAVTSTPSDSLRKPVKPDTVVPAARIKLSESKN